ncbi:LysE/ArgO family amino acid transporter [Pararhodospirillum photometricum]|nr:LysE/ArgO family amino acid transporter [Pararhodospirillum photometricum]
MDSYLTGLAMGFSLIVAIGAQNAFVLRQGVRGEHVLAVVLACALSDALLIALGVGGFQTLIQSLPWLDPVLRYGGAAFLLWYGALSLRRALGPAAALALASDTPAPLGRTLATCLALTWLNPHVYLDTVVLLGTLSTRFPGDEPWFGAGAVTASFVFFFALGFGARFLRRWLASPACWRGLEAVIAVIMASIAIKLLVLE